MSSASDGKKSCYNVSDIWGCTASTGREDYKWQAVASDHHKTDTTVRANNRTNLAALPLAA